MSTLAVWKFDSSDGADVALETLERLKTQQLVQLQDAAIVRWPEDAKKPSITELDSLVGAGVLGGAFWGALFCLLFLSPALGLAIAAGVGALMASTADVGIDEQLIKELRTKITPGTSGLFLLTASAVADLVLDEMKAQRGHVELIESNLTREQESKLRKIFAAERPEKPPVVIRPSAA